LRVHSKLTLANLLKWVAVGLAIFQLYTAGFGVFPNVIQRSIHIGVVLILAFGMSKVDIKEKYEIKGNLWIGILMALASLLTLYTVINYEKIVTNINSIAMIDKIIAVLYLLLILEGARRVIGWFFPLMLMVFVTYPFIPGLPGPLNHGGFSFNLVAEQLYMGTTGFWGTVTGISATVIAIYVIFGSLLLGLGGGEVFVDLAKAAGRSVGGPAKISVIASAIFGSINGTVPANVATTGAFTISMMKRLGYKPEFAAAVEATASTGGQVLPPVMGAGAFIMAELLGVPYLSIAAAAAIPAILYFVACYAGVHFEAKKSNYKGLNEEEIPKMKDVLKIDRSIPALVPLFTLIYLIIAGYSPIKAGFWAIVIMIFFYIVFCRNMTDLKELLLKIITSLEDGGKGLVMVVPLVLVAQTITSIIGLTALGMRFSELLMSFSGGIPLIGLFLGMVIVIILGMGVSTVAAYILGASIVAPSLVGLGVPALSAHLFIFFFAALSNITPPVCSGVFVGAAIARANWFKSALIAMQLGIAGYITPYCSYINLNYYQLAKLSQLFGRQ